MIKIATIDANSFKYGEGEYLKGDYEPDYRVSGGVLGVRLKNKHTGQFVAGTSYTPFTKFVNASDTAFANEQAFKTALVSILAKTDNLDGVASDRGAVTQATNVTTAVTLNFLNGIITTQAQTLAADAQNTFTVNNSKVKSDSTVLLTAIYPAASAGSPVVRVGAISNGSFTIVVTNAGTAALNAALRIGFAVL